MPDRIVAEIDALIARLAAAREILATFLPEAGAPVHEMRLVTMQARESSKPAAPPPVEVTVLKPRERRARRAVARPAPSPSALAGHIPLQPVAVSPRQLLAAREIRIAEEAKEAAAANAPRSAFDELMLEVAQRSA